MGKRFSINKNVLVIVVFLFLAIPHFTLFAETPPIWGNLTPGSYAVGFKTIEQYDFSRNYQPQKDYFGNPIEGERARKIQICVWYPSVADDNALPMVYGEYSLPYPENADFLDMLNNLHNRQIAQLFGFLNRNRRLVSGFMNTTMAGMRDAQAVEGQFPLIIYHPSAMASYIDNVVLCEYLAGHGFIVATTHPVGMNQLNPGNNRSDFETTIRDAEFVYAYMQDFPNVDNNKLGCLGFGSGGSAALLFQMRNSDVDAIVGLGSPYTIERLIELTQGNSYYNPGKVLAPLMHMYYDDEQPADLKLIDSLTYSSKYLIKLDGTTALNYCIGEAAASMVPDSGNAIGDPRSPIYKIVCNYVYHFFNGQLNGDETSLSFIKNPAAENGYDPEMISSAFLAAEEIPPTSDQFVDIITRYSVAEGVKLFEKFNNTNPGSLTFPEATFNAMGYRLIGGGEVADGCEILRLNTVAYPNSANVWDSYADGLIASGNTEKAGECYRKVLEILPADTILDDNFRQILQTNAENFLNPPPDEN